MKVRLLIGVVLSALFLVLMLRGVELTQLGGFILTLNPLVLLPAAACYFLGVWIRALRWQQLLAPVGFVPIGRLFAVELIGFGVNNVMPVRIGELVRAGLLARSPGIRPASALGSILVERVLDGLLLSLMLTVGLLTLPMNEWLQHGVRIAAVGFSLGALAILVAALAPDLAGRLVRALSRRAPAKLGQRLESHGLAALAGFGALTRGRALPGIVLLTVACWLAEAGVYWFVMLGFGIHVGYVAGVLGMAAANLATVMPSSPGYVGTFDWPLQAVLVSAYGVDPAQAVAYTLVTHALIVLPVAFIGLMLLAREGISLASIRLGRGLVRVASPVVVRDQSQA